MKSKRESLRKLIYFLILILIEDASIFTLSLPF